MTWRFVGSVARSQEFASVSVRVYTPVGSIAEDGTQEYPDRIINVNSDMRTVRGGGGGGDYCIEYVFV